MSNPFLQIETALAAKLLTITGIKAAQIDNGESDDTKRSEATRRNGAMCFVEVFGGDKDQASPYANDRSQTLISIELVYPNSRSRSDGGEDAKQLLWNIYKALVRQNLNYTWLFPLQYSGWEKADGRQTPTTTIIELVLTTSFDMALWTE